MIKIDIKMSEKTSVEDRKNDFIAKSVLFNDDNEYKSFGDITKVFQRQGVCISLKQHTRGWGVIFDGKTCTVAENKLIVKLLIKLTDYNDHLYDCEYDLNYFFKHDFGMHSMINVNYKKGQFMNHTFPLPFLTDVGSRHKMNIQNWHIYINTSMVYTNDLKKLERLMIWTLVTRKHRWEKS